MSHAPGRALAAEFIGSLILFATVVGSGVMAQRLAGGNDAVALLGNTGATGAVLYVLITLLGPVSGAHFNPAVTVMLGARRDWLPFIAAQFVGGILGVLIVHAMFDMTILQTGIKPRTGTGQWIGEFIATFGLLFTIVVGSRQKPEAVPALVALWIVAGYWFTSSTSFANPAITVARAMTTSFAGIRPIDAPGFIFAQFVGAAAGAIIGRWINGPGITSDDRLYPADAS
ncbi:MIP/aquaporin family protein [Sphingomonas sp. 28-63-12]|uniref:aquaporin n=1 Tax=Sphingomonas sp. 28-63-12 TaxID=1970434 RepID=UPI000BC7F1D2|nr:MAG: aquaporin family protein [Sphingomonas sp. 28-63-12]